MSSGIEPEELAALAEMGRPQPGDDSMMVVTRTLLRSVVSLSKAVDAHRRSLDAVDGRLAALTESVAAAGKLAEELAPENDADAHISVRVRRLERTGSGILAVLKSNSGSIFLALLLGAYYLLSKVAH